MRRGILTVVSVLLCGCQTYRAYVPEIAEHPREGLDLRTPVMMAVLDGRAEKSKSNKIAGALTEGLSHAYGDAVEWCSYFGETPPGRVMVGIRVAECGAVFHGELTSAVAATSSWSDVQGTVTDGWDTVLVSGSVQSSAVGTAMTGEGWWTGRVRLEVRVHDRRGGNLADFAVPIEAEDRQFNLRGYGSAKEAGRQAWLDAFPRLMALLDAALMKIRDEEAAPPRGR